MKTNGNDASIIKSARTRIKMFPFPCARVYVCVRLRRVKTKQHKNKELKCHIWPIKALVLHSPRLRNGGAVVDTYAYVRFH